MNAYATLVKAKERTRRTANVGFFSFSMCLFACCAFFAAQPKDEAEGQREDDGDDGRERHAPERHRAECEACRRYADAHDNRGQQKIRGFAIVYLGFDEDADARGGDDAEEQHGDAAHDGRRDALDECGEFAEA